MTNRITPLVLPRGVTDFWITIYSRRGKTTFERSVRKLVYYATHHGARSVCLPLLASVGMMKPFMHSQRRRRVFLEKCHEGFEITQDEISRLLPPAERDLPRVRKLYLREIQEYKKRKEPPLPKYTTAGKTFYAASFESMVLREIANCIAWQILGDDGTQVRALIQGKSSGPARDDQLRDVLTSARIANARDRSSFALLTDITSCIQVGDLLVRLPGGQGVGLCEVKDGQVNDIIANLLTMSPNDEATWIQFAELARRFGKPFVKQFERTLRQRDRMQKALSYMKEAIGIDIQYGVPKMTDVTPRDITTYHKEMNRLLKKVRRGKEAYTIIDGCLVIGVFNNITSRRDRHVCQMDFQHYVHHLLFEKWADCPYVGSFDEKKVQKHFEYMLLPVHEMRHKVWIPTHRPIFICGLDLEDVYNVLFERVSIFFYFSPQLFVELCKSRGIDAAIVTGKEYRRVTAEAAKEGMMLLDLHDSIIRFQSTADKYVEHVALGVLCRILYEFQRPSSIADLCKEDLENLKERGKRMADFEEANKPIK